MTGADNVVCQAAALLLLFALTTAPAKAQFGVFGGGGGDMMTQFAPMLEMMKAKMGNHRFGMMIQTMGPMTSRMAENGGGFGGFGGGIPGGFGGDMDGAAFARQGYGMRSIGGSDFFPACSGAAVAALIWACEILPTAHLPALAQSLSI
jgi:hypothetical protein